MRISTSFETVRRALDGVQSFLLYPLISAVYDGYMEMRQVLAFLRVAEEKHFGRAASRLHVTQPAITQAIQALEEEVGAPLFIRTNRRVELTAAGQFFLEHASNAELALERALTEARRASRGEVGRLRLAFTAVSALGLVPLAIGEMRRRFPDVQVTASSLGTTDQVEALRSGRLDIGFTVLPGAKGALIVEPVNEAPLMAVLPRAHKLAGHASIKMADLAGEPRILMSRAAEPAMHAIYSRFCEDHGVPPNIAFEVDQLDTMLAFVAAGLGVSHAPAMISTISHAGVVVLPISPRIQAGISAMWDPGVESPARDRFLSILRGMVAGPPP